jgi:ElaB/YqjD/DUF883 family membrane-anchored ribosome-binding protein
MPSTSPAASEAARALIQSRWDRVTDPVERTAATAAATKGRLDKLRERREASLKNQRERREAKSDAYWTEVQQIVAEAGPLTAEQRDKIALILQGGEK